MSQLPALDNTMGATLIGVIVAAALWGVACVQVYVYYSTYPKDPWHLKTLVAAVLISDTVHQILISHSIYTYLVTNFGNDVELGNIVWSILVEVLFSGITGLLVQSFLAFRVYKFSNRNVYITGLVALLVIGEFSKHPAFIYQTSFEDDVGLQSPSCVSLSESIPHIPMLTDLRSDYTIKAFHIKTYVALTALKGPSMTINAIGAAGDVLIALVLCTMLQKSRTGFKRSDTMITKLVILLRPVQQRNLNYLQILFSVNTGLLTSICAVASLVSILAAPTTFIYIAFFFNMVYSNTLMATLNARRAIRTGGTSDEVMSISLNGARSAIAMTPSATASRNLAVRVDTHRELTRDTVSFNPKRVESIEEMKVDVDADSGYDLGDR
ncbi:hypothetical protein HWV62_27041 [Athelia sp. TMB]|nr:hypothetical protein HWV62_27041 [Athelia sp. TMB]